MKTLSIMAMQSLSIVCVICACVSLVYDKSGWGWFLLVAVIASSMWEKG